jgi:hypothetical protein
MEAHMKKFLVLYRANVPADEMMANSTPEQMKAGMDAWGAWMGGVGDAMLDLGAPLGASRSVDQGSPATGGAHVTGFSVLQADSLDAAAALVENHPHLSTPGGASVEILEYLPIPGM